ncbi:unnamed protein product [Cylindrotheca closterium]|uniref:Prolyl 4-hydroxylase alpha subunit Fe(2+) 2OG dioxygenase domain-containing protein n=1 Tax=Cylindrotheca closterium TaxID=2856 RepID=A0AAD2PWR8_9STRA|nr:unnamed protein product [Cylindrotheca closterium]
MRRLQVYLMAIILVNSLQHSAVVVYSQAEETDIDFPPLIDSDDISYFFEDGDLDGLHWALTNIFYRGERNPDEKVIKHKLPNQLIARGGGSTYTTQYKLLHDLEQTEYLAKHLAEKSRTDMEEAVKKNNEEKAKFFGTTIAPIYHALLEKLPPLHELERTGGLYPFEVADYAAGLDSIYNKALHQTNFDELRDQSTGELIPLLNPDLDVASIEASFRSEGVVVIDNVLTPKALERIRQLMLESTVFFQTKMPLKFGGYVGAYIDDGLHDRILLQLAFELYEKLPTIMKGHFLKYLWAYKYDSEYTGINLHADQAAVNVNLWLTPDEANLDPNSGGLVVFTAKPPADWDFARFNTDTEEVHDLLLKPTNYDNVTVPHRQNRAVLFDSALFHQTDEYSFKKGYENRRINLTFLYGEMQKQGVSQSSEL